MDLDLKGRRAIVTGGSKGIGFAIAKTLLAEGVAVSICARDPDEVTSATSLLAKNGATVLGQAADVTDPAQVEAFISSSAKALGGLEILVNNAGRAHPGDFSTLTDRDFQEDLDVKLFSQIRCTRAALPHLRGGRGAVVININAIYGRQVDPAFFATTVDRAACLALSKALAMELGPENIRVNSVNIGFVRTPQWDAIHQRRAPELTRDEFFSNTVRGEVPLGRFGEPQEVAGLVAFLASRHASYITGASIDVGGGMGRYV
ncbi:MAG: SDR family oxidoreductase [Candidatus Dormibacteraeota bacterium]|nr:SDR family oxidoreductase [Candidatus Dormibacteraeota bacterium]